MMNYNFVMKTHKIFIGDICYALNNDIYDKIWGDKLDFEDGLIKADNGDICAIVGSTAYGDGSYEDQHGNVYPVDAGVIGVTDVENYPCNHDISNFSDLGKIINIPSGEVEINFSCKTRGIFDIKIKEKGRIISEININTFDYHCSGTYAYDDDDEDDECADYYDGDDYSESLISE